MPLSSNDETDTLNELLDRDVSTLQLRTMTYNSLSKSNITTIRQLVATSAKRLHGKTPGLGRRGVSEIERALDKLHLKFKTPD